MQVKKRIALGLIATGIVLLAMATFMVTFGQAPTLILALWPLYWIENVDFEVTRTYLNFSKLT